MKNYLKLSRLLLIIGVVLFSAYLYYPGNGIEEVNLGDVNTSETIDYPFEIKWEDEGFESNRPSSITYNLYNVLDENAVVSTVTLTTSNVDNSDSNRWNGVFENVPKYNSDESLAQYIIKSENINGYNRKYRFDINSPYTYRSYKSMCITFAPNALNGDPEKYINLISLTTVSYPSWNEPQFRNIYIKNENNNSIEYHESDLNNQTICIPINPYRYELYITGDTNDINIKNIYLSTSATSYHSGGYVNDNEYEVFYGDDFENIKSNKPIKYIYNFAQTNKNNFPGANLFVETYSNINLKVDKYWDDEGYEEFRPTSTTIKLYKKNQPNIVIDSIELNSSSQQIDNNHWVGYFNNLPRFDNNGNKIEYMVREDNANNYINYYDASDGLIITFDERTNMAVDYSTSMFIRRKSDNEWYEFHNSGTGSTIGKFISGNKILFDFNDTAHISMVNSLPSMDNYIKNSSYKKVIELYGDDYPEQIHNMPIWEYDVWHYKTTPTDNAQEFYIYYNGASWGNVFGLKIDNIENIGDETIITSKINLKDIQVTKIWDDEGFENQRVESVRLMIYSDKELRNLYREETIGNSNRIDNNTWKKTIKNLPKYDNNGKEIDYYIKEENIDNYLTTYDRDESYNALSIQFSDDSIFNAHICFIDLGNTCTGYSSPFFFEYNPSYASGNAWASRTLNIPYKEFYIFYDYNINPEYSAKIISIEPTKIMDTSTSNSYNFSYPYIYDHSYDDYFDTDDLQLYNVRGSKTAWHYVWKGSKTPLSNDVVIKNEINLTSFVLDKYWNDDGYESERENISISLYDTKDLNTPIITRQFDSSSQDINDSNHWIIKFDNLVKYDENREIINYSAKENNVESYKQLYSKKEYNGLCIKFGDNVYNGNDNSTKFYVKTANENNYYELRAPGTYHSYVYLQQMDDKTVCLPVDPATNDFYMDNSTKYLNIESIYPVYMEKYNVTTTSVSVPNNCVIREGDDYSNVTDYRCIHYTWIENTSYFPGVDLITNIANMRDEGYTKEFNDEGLEYNRPKELVFGLYLEDDPVPKEMVTLNTNTCENNTCTIEFKHVKDKDSEGNPIEYEIREISDYGYTVTYNGDTVTNTANPVDVKFIKVNNEGKAIREAKLAIYNKSGDKLKEFTSSNREVTIKLLPSEYTIKELEPPEGYERINDIHIVVNEDGTYTQDGNAVETIRIVNEPIKEKYNINLKKTLKTNEEKEFEFEINIIGYEGTLEYDGDKTGTLTFTDGKAIVKLGGNQSITIKDIPVNSKYEVREIGSDYLVTIVGETNGVLNRNETIEFINSPRSVPGNGDIVIPEEKEVPTPITGVFNILSYIAGILLLIGSIFLIVYSKKQIKKES